MVSAIGGGSRDGSAEPGPMQPYFAAKAEADGSPGAGGPPPHDRPARAGSPTTPAPGA